MIIIIVHTNESSPEIEIATYKYHLREDTHNNIIAIKVFKMTNYEFSLAISSHRILADIVYSYIT